MSERNWPKYLRRTTAPFAIDRTGVTVPVIPRSMHIQRLIGPGSIEYVISGRGTVTENNITFEVGAGDVFLLHEGNYHDYYPDPDDPWTKIWVQTSGPAAEEILRAYGLDKVNSIPSFDLKEDMFRIHHLINNDTDVETIDREGPRLFLELVQKIHDELRRRNKNGRAPSPAEEIRRYIDSLSDGDVSLNRLCGEFHFSKQYLIRIFKARYSTSPHEYILNRRVVIAQSLLKKTNLSVKEISEQLHFCDISYFTDFFRRRTGQTPSEYRKKHRDQ
ncbi:MAG: AraC family transcriptional regulator [Clostridia bacterium]|nr:AraC family transcriptional regulator [Clostridia bacterium]